MICPDGEKGERSGHRIVWSLGSEAKWHWGTFKERSSRDQKVLAYRNKLPFW